jgi:hypothetical protein
MKYALTLFTLSACGVWAANAGITANKRAVSEENFMEEKTGDEKMARIMREEVLELYNQPTYIDTVPQGNGADAQPSPIPALILPNNVCVINTDLSPDRSIEEHILACIYAQRIRRSIQR